MEQTYLELLKCCLGIFLSSQAMCSVRCFTNQACDGCGFQGDEKTAPPSDGVHLRSYCPFVTELIPGELHSSLYIATCDSRFWNLTSHIHLVPSNSPYTLSTISRPVLGLLAKSCKHLSKTFQTTRAPESGNPRSCVLRSAWPRTSSLRISWTPG